MEGGDSEFANFILPTLKAFLEARSLAIGCPKTHFFPWNRNHLVSQKITQRHFFSTLHHLSTVIFATATVVAFVLLRNSSFNFHCYTQREPTPTQKSSRKRQLRSFTVSCAKDYEGYLFTRANRLRWIAQNQQHTLYLKMQMSLLQLQASRGGVCVPWAKVRC